MHIITEITVRVFTLIQHQRRSHLLKEYLTHAESDPFSQPLPEASHDEAPFSGSLNVSMKSKGKNVDVSLCDEASSDLPKTSEDVDVNLNISGAPRCDEAPSSSSSSSGPTKSKSVLIRSIRKDIDNVKDFNLDDLMKHMSELLKLREKDRQSFGIVARKLKDMREPLKALQRAIGNAGLVFSSALLVAETVEIFDTAFTNTEKCWHLIKEMNYVAIVHKSLKESAEGMQDVMQDATSLTYEGALVCCTQIGGSASTR